MTENELPPDDLLLDSRVHALLGLITGTIIASIGVLFFDGVAMYAFIAFGVFYAISTPYIFGKVMEGADDTEQAAEGW